VVLLTGLYCLWNTQNKICFENTSSTHVKLITAQCLM